MQTESVGYPGRGTDIASGTEAAAAAAADRGQPGTGAGPGSAADGAADAAADLIGAAWGCCAVRPCFAC